MVLIDGAASQDSVKFDGETFLHWSLWPESAGCSVLNPHIASQCKRLNRCKDINDPVLTGPCTALAI